MTRAQAKATAEVCARHVHAQMDRLIRFEFNPSKVRCGVKALADYLHSTCSELSRSGADERIEEYFIPLIDAQGLFTEALLCARLSHDLIHMGQRKLKRVVDQIESN